MGRADGSADTSDIRDISRPPAALNLPITGVTECRSLMLIVEEHAIASLFSTSRGYAAEAYHPHSICMAASKHVPSAIRHGRYAALWLEIPRSARSIPISNRPAVFNELALWVRTARMSGVPACLVGLRGVAWQNEHLARLVTDRVIHESRHQLCHYGLAMIETDQPSRVSYHAFTTFSAESGLCRCPPDTEHIHEFSKNVQHTTVRRVRTETELFQRLMTTWLFASAPAHSGDRPRLRSIPDSAPTTGGSTKRVHFEPQHAAENHRYSELHLSEQSAQTVVAFPTASKERAKERKKAGQKPRKLPKVVEDHYDDLGDDLSGLGSDLTYLSADVVRETLDIDSDYDTDDEQFVQGLSIWYLKGSGPIEFLPEGAMRFPLLDNLLQFLATAGDGLDLCEICGGSARTSQVAVRRRLHAGRNFDLVANIDVGLPHNQTPHSRVLGSPPGSRRRHVSKLPNPRRACQHQPGSQLRNLAPTL